VLRSLWLGPLANDQIAAAEDGLRRLRRDRRGDGAIGLAATVWQAGLARAAAWLARGVRSPARDAMLAS
jgi:hypothetical protein